MHKPIEFINRDIEKDVIASIIASPKSRLLYIQGEGGVGKTRLLAEIPTILEDRSIPAICIEAIDFDDLSFQFTDNLIHLLLDRIHAISERERE